MPSPAPLKAPSEYDSPRDSAAGASHAALPSSSFRVPVSVASVASSNDTPLSSDDAEFARRFAAFQAEAEADLPPHLEGALPRHALLLNFSVIHWYHREVLYLFAFRVLFAFLYQSVPLVVGAVAVWSRACDRQAAGVLEVILVGSYTGPILHRSYAEYLALRAYVPAVRLVAIQADVPLVASLYGVFAATKHAADSDTRALVSLGYAAPAFLLFVYLSLSGRTSYAFGWHGLLVGFPAALRVNRVSGAPTLRRRLAAARDEASALARTAVSAPRRALRTAAGKAVAVADDL